MAPVFINCTGHYVNINAIESFNEVTQGIGENTKTWVEVRTRSGQVRSCRSTLTDFKNTLLLLADD